MPGKKLAKKVTEKSTNDEQKKKKSKHRAENAR